MALNPLGSNAGSCNLMALIQVGHHREKYSNFFKIYIKLVEDTCRENI